MDGIGNIIPRSVPIEIAGQIWQCAPWTLEDDSEVERLIVSRWKRPMEAAAEMVRGQPDDVRRIVLGHAFDAECRGFRATPQDCAKFYASPEGRMVTFYLRARKNHPVLTMAMVEDLFQEDADAAEAAESKAAKLTGEEPLGNSSSRTTGPAEQVTAEK